MDTVEVNYDVIVIGGGPMGLSTAYHLSKRNTRTLVLEQFTFFNQLGSSAGTCLVALSKIPNKELLIDFAPLSVPNYKDVVIYATGWAGKFVPLLGKILTDLALDGHTRFDISHFRTGSTYFTGHRKSDLLTHQRTLL
jgi:glycine/D-amino acid oxidase-like deaminating enzyme